MKRTYLIKEDVLVVYFSDTEMPQGYVNSEIDLFHWKKAAKRVPVHEDRDTGFIYQRFFAGFFKSKADELLESGIKLPDGLVDIKKYCEDSGFVKEAAFLIEKEEDLWKEIFSNSTISWIRCNEDIDIVISRLKQHYSLIKKK